MPYPRKSLAAARISGAFAKNPHRYKNRREPVVAEPVGPPPAWLSSIAKKAWREFDESLPWLNSSHRSLLEISSTLQAKLRVGALGVPGMQLLRQCLGQLCATPTDASKIATPIEGDNDDLLD